MLLYYLELLWYIPPTQRGIPIWPFGGISARPFFGLAFPHHFPDGVNKYAICVLCHATLCHRGQGLLHGN